MDKYSFDESTLTFLGDLIKKSEEIVADYYKMSTSDWSRLRYDIRTLKDLKKHEVVDESFAQVMKYDARPWGRLLASSMYTIYRVCIQDHYILKRMKENNLNRIPFFYYIIVHELIHVVRFSTYIQKFDAADNEMMEEEKRVHILTRKILEKLSIPDKSEVFDFFKKKLSY